MRIPRIKSIFLIALFLSLFFSFLWAIRMSRHVAVGTFYYWLPGYESNESPEWSGPDTLWMFRSRVWDKRKPDFYFSVWNAGRRKYGWKKCIAEKFNTTMDTVTFGGVERSFTKLHVYVTSTDASFAAEVANACMEALAETELNLQMECRDKGIGYASSLICRAQRRLKELKQENQPFGRDEKGIADQIVFFEKQISQAERQLAELDRLDCRTNVLMKVIASASAQTAMFCIFPQWRMKAVRDRWNEINYPGTRPSKTMPCD